mgnify:CR=1 FL=1
MIIETVITCDGCNHILGKIRDDGRVEIRHRGIEIRTPYCDVVCPRCKRPKLDIKKMIDGALQYCS